MCTNQKQNKENQTLVAEISRTHSAEASKSAYSRLNEGVRLSAGSFSLKRKTRSHGAKPAISIARESSVTTKSLYHRSIVNTMRISVLCAPFASAMTRSTRGEGTYLVSLAKGRQHEKNGLIDGRDFPHAGVDDSDTHVRQLK